MNILAHPILTYNRLLERAILIPEIHNELVKGKDKLENTTDRKEQVNEVQMLCMKVISALASRLTQSTLDYEKISKLTIPVDEPTTYNFELVINKAIEISRELKEAFLSKDASKAIDMLEYVVIETRNLLVRIKGSSLYDEIKKITGVDENTIYSILETEDYFEGRRKITEIINLILTFISTHFK